MPRIKKVHNKNLLLLLDAEMKKALVPQVVENIVFQQEQDGALPRKVPWARRNKLK